MLSIVIPVYRVESTLDRCIESILRQGYEDWEMLLIDDGSPDRCPEMCDAWAQRDQRITAYHKPNGGLSDARNYGIERARGEYITFVDSDDELAPGTLHPLMDVLINHTECDVVEYPMLVHAGNNDEHLLVLPDRVWATARKYWHETMAWEHCYACNKIYRSALFDELRFAKGRIFEDVWLWPEILSHKPNIATSSKGMYIYRWNNEGITVKATPHDLWQLLVAQVRAAWLMRTTPFLRSGRRLYRSMLCRLYDIIRFSI